MAMGDPEIEEWQCPLGCQVSSELVLASGDRLHALPGRFQVVRCQECGLMRTSPRPTAASIARYYPAEYGPHKDVQAAPPPPSRSRPRRWLARLLDHRANAIPPVAPGRVLEVGCGRGEFLDRMRSTGWTVTAQEVSTQTAEALEKRSLEVHVGSISSLPLSWAPFDLIAGFMVLEHLHDPIGDLKHLRALAAPDGWLVLSTPNTRSFDFSAFGKRWYGLQVPTHLVHYDPRTISKVLHAAGWRVERVLHQRTMSDTIASLGYVIAEKTSFRSVGQRLVDFPESGSRSRHLLWPLAVLVAGLRRSSRMTIWARPA